MRLEELCQLRGVSGDEKEVHDFLYNEYKKRNLPIYRKWNFIERFCTAGSGFSPFSCW